MILFHAVLCEALPRGDQPALHAPVELHVKALGDEVGHAALCKPLVVLAPDLAVMKEALLALALA